MKNIKSWERLFKATANYNNPKYICNEFYNLTDREQRILEMRFGLEFGIPCTLEEVARGFGVTRERIRQIEIRAIEKLK